MAERRAVVRAAAIVVALTAGCTGYSLSPASPSCATSSQELMRSSCTVCHTAAGAARGIVPEGLDFETDAEVRRHSDIIRQAALIDMVMPPGAPLSVCDQNMLAAYLDDLASQPCTPSCDGRLCGSDACGGSCGDCPASQTCNPAGQCMTTTCIPSCEGKACGGDGCGGMCGACAAALSCSQDGACLCTPDCAGRACGDDGCGGSCGSCATSAVCSTGGACVCTPNCAGKQCGPDGCGGTCGTCAAPASCDTGGACVCVPSCSGRVCGPDGCGGSCGTCAAQKICNTLSGTCASTCTPNCSGRTCGDDGCGGACGSCAGGQACSSTGQCMCAASCSGKQCGPDGCGGSCGTCAAGLGCSVTGQCACTPNCAGRTCGSDGCGGTCGTCGAGLACGVNGQCACAPSCGGKSCGPDGCGGVCGSCATTQTCSSGQCVWASKSFAADVFPMFQAAGCAGNGCHTGGARSAANLDLSTAAAGFAALVGVRTDQCNGGKTRVVAGDTTASYLMAKLTGVGMCSGSVMPKAGGELSAAQLDVIRAWIGAGAAR